MTNHTGNNYGLGETRKNELTKACQRLRIHDCIVVDQKDIQDNPTQWWDEGIVVPLVKSWVAKLRPDAVCFHPSIVSQRHCIDLADVTDHNI